MPAQCSEPVGQQLRGAEQRGHVDVMSAGVHDRNLAAVAVGDPHRAGVLEPGGLLHG